MAIASSGLLGLLGAGLPRTELRAQTVELRLREDSSRKPIAGAIVRLLRNDTAVAQALTDENGRAVLRTDLPASYQVRVDRIGFTGFLSKEFALDPGMTFRAELPIASSPVALPEIVVHTSASRCEMKQAEGELAATLWDEVRKALTANLITQQDQAVPLLVREFERDVNRTGKVLREWVFRASQTGGQPFGALPARLLAKVGFVYPDRDTTVFAVPDAQLLLSDEFVATHCFRAVPGPANRIGLAFDPAPDRTVTDVSGTLWVNRVTSELQELEFEYTDLPASLRREALGGRVEFQRLPAGNWIISYWHVRMPVFESFERFRMRRAAQEITRLVSFVERGGRTVIAPASAVPTDRAVIAGRVLDYAAGRGLAGAVVTLEGRADSAFTAESGEFGFALQASGPTTISARHAKLTPGRGSIGKEIVLSLGDTTRVEFAAPPLAQLIRARCGSVGRRAGVIGLAWRSDSRPHPGVELRASWRTPLGSVRTVEDRSDELGGFAFCDLPPDQPVTLQIRQGDEVLTEASVMLGWAEFQWVELRPTRP